MHHENEKDEEEERQNAHLASKGIGAEKEAHRNSLGFANTRNTSKMGKEWWQSIEQGSRGQKPQNTKQGQGRHDTQRRHDLPDKSLGDSFHSVGSELSFDSEDDDHISRGSDRNKPRRLRSKRVPTRDRRREGMRRLVSDKSLGGSERSLNSRNSTNSENEACQVRPTCSSAVEKRLVARGLPVPTVQVAVPRPAFKPTPSRSSSLRNLLVHQDETESTISSSDSRRGPRPRRSSSMKNLLVDTDETDSEIDSVFVSHAPSRPRRLSRSISLKDVSLDRVETPSAFNSAATARARYCPAVGATRLGSDTASGLKPPQTLEYNGTDGVPSDHPKDVLHEQNTTGRPTWHRSMSASSLVCPKSRHKPRLQQCGRRGALVKTQSISSLLVPDASSDSDTEDDEHLFLGQHEHHVPNAHGAGHRCSRAHRRAIHRNEFRLTIGVK